MNLTTYNKYRAPHQRQGGYTLLEMLVVIAIILLIIPVLYASIDALYDAHATSLATSFAEINAAKTVDAIVRDIRAAVSGEDGSLPIVSFGTSSIVFFCDTDMDGRVEYVRYYLSGTTLQKGIVEPTSTSSYPLGTETVSVLATQIVNGETGTPLFRYYSATSTEITAVAQILSIRRVESTVMARARFRLRARDVAVTSSASIRNLKDYY